MMTDAGLHVVLVVNPAAGGGAARRVAEAATAALAADGHRVEAVDARGAVHAAADAVVAVGGDGTVSAALDAIGGTGAALGILPVGTGNDVARALGIPLRDDRAALEGLRRALRSGGRAIDLGVVAHAAGERLFLGVVSAGFDAVVNARANALRRPRGGARYVVALLSELRRMRPWRCELVLDGERRVSDAVIVSIANTGLIGGGMRIAPDADPADGALDVVIVAPLLRLRLLALFPRVFAGTHTRLREVEVVRATRVEVRALEGHRPVTAHADGEPVAAAPYAVSLRPGALRVLA